MAGKSGEFRVSCGRAGGIGIGMGVSMEILRGVASALRMGRGIAVVGAGWVGVNRIIIF